MISPANGAPRQLIGAVGRRLRLVSLGLAAFPVLRLPVCVGAGVVFEPEGRRLEELCLEALRLEELRFGGAVVVM